MSQNVYEGTLAVETKTLHGIKRVPKWNHIGRSTVKYREKPTVTLYTYINPVMTPSAPRPNVGRYDFSVNRKQVVVWIPNGDDTKRE